VPYNKIVDVKALPAAVDWRKKGAMTPVKDQGGCGSCYAHAAVEVIESLSFLKTGKLVQLSTQQASSCTDNPHHCGGTGGCAGGTAQVVYESITTRGGIETSADYPYKSGSGSDFQCKFEKSKAAVQLNNYTQLPHNEYEPLLDAVATVGPIAISVDASAWSFYESGVFDGCDQSSPDVDHAVVLAGYGTDAGQDYWIVRNSWGPSWGEEGYIRLARSATPKCGTDSTPEHGSGCDGGPKTVQACGQCSILFDSCYPIIA
jgi:cathepsin L